MLLSAIAAATTADAARRRGASSARCGTRSPPPRTWPPWTGSAGAALVVQPTVSWHRDEYDALGVPFGHRGDILDEQLEIWSRAWAGSPVRVRRHATTRFGEVWLEPQPSGPAGRRCGSAGRRLHPRLIARLVRYGRGFNPLGQPDDAGLARLAAALTAAGLAARRAGVRGRHPRRLHRARTRLADLDQALARDPGPAGPRVHDHLRQSRRSSPTTRRGSAISAGSWSRRCRCWLDPPRRR